MGPCSHALYTCLVNDLKNGVLSKYNLEDLLAHDTRKRDLWAEGAPPREFAALALLDSIVKKFEDDAGPEAEKAALDKFLRGNEACLAYTESRVGPVQPDIKAAEDLFDEEFANFFVEGPYYWLNPLVIAKAINHGPGSSVNTSGETWYEKTAASPLCGTSGSLYSVYLNAVSACPSWTETENIRSARFGTFALVPGSKLCFQPKQFDEMRVIATEPPLNMLVQKGISSPWRTELKRRFGISLEIQQEKNKELARIGSITGRFGTIDLVSASDSISLLMMREKTPPYVLRWLELARCSETRLPVLSGSKKPPGSVQLNMISSMGNDFTFPLQTTIFACVVIAVYRYLGIRTIFPRGKSLGNFAVNGDDIIVEAQAYDLVCRLLGRLGFQVNHKKSFNMGAFRESCGGDFLAGYNVRGVYIHTLRSRQDVLSAINRLNVWSSNHGVSLTTTVEFLFRRLSPSDVLLVPPWESETAGLRVPWCMAAEDTQKRTENGLVAYLRYEARADSVRLTHVDTDADAPKRSIRESRKVRKELKQRGIFVNKPGIFLSAIAGYLRDGNLTKRTYVTRYSKRIAVAPCWEWHNPQQSGLTAAGWRSFYYYVSSNLETSWGRVATTEVASSPDGA